MLIKAGSTSVVPFYLSLEYVSCCFFFVGMGALVVSRPMFGLWGWLVFWFGLFFGFCWDGWGGFCSRALCWLYVGWDGMRMGGYIVGKSFCMAENRIL